MRVTRKRVWQRRALHLGELNTTQLERWQRTQVGIDHDNRAEVSCAGFLGNAMALFNRLLKASTVEKITFDKQMFI